MNFMKRIMLLGLEACFLALLCACQKEIICTLSEPSIELAIPVLRIRCTSPAMFRGLSRYQVMLHGCRLRRFLGRKRKKWN